MENLPHMPPPPAPAGLNDFPENTEDTILYEKDLKSISKRVPVGALLTALYLPFAPALLADPTIVRVQTAKLTIKGRWEKLFFTTIGVGEGITHTIEVFHGVTSSNSQTIEFGTDIGAKGDLASISTKLRQVTQSQYTVTENKKETYDIKKSVKTPTTVCWWHQVLTFETSGKISEFADIKILGSRKKKRVLIGSRPYVHEIVVGQQTYPETSYPAE